MRRWVAFVSSAACGLGAMLQACAGNPAPAPGGGLSAPVELRDAQSGFAGTTGTLWRIEPDGRFVVSSFVNERSGAESQRGRLDARALAQVAEALRAQRLDALPPRLGSAGAVNPRTLSITQGATTVTLLLPAGDPTRPDTPASASGDEGRALRLFQTLRDAVERSR